MPRLDCLVLSFRLPGKEAAQVRRLAAAQGVTVSDALRDLLREHLLTSSPSRP